MGISCADHVTPLYPQKLALTSPTGGGRSVLIVRSRTKATEFFFSTLNRIIFEINVSVLQLHVYTGCFCVSLKVTSKQLITLDYEYIFNHSVAVHTVYVNTAGYARTKVNGSRTSFVIASVGSSIHCNICIKG